MRVVAPHLTVEMIASYPGFHELLIPDVAAYELAAGGSHDSGLPTEVQVCA